MTKYVYLLRAEGHEDMIFEQYSAACNEAKREAQKEYDLELFKDCKKHLEVHRTQVSVGVLDPKGGWYYPYVGDIIKHKLN